MADNNKNKDLEKRIKKEMGKKSNTRLVVILCSCMLVVVVGLIAYSMMSKSYDAAQTTQTTTQSAVASYYKNEITIDQMQAKVQQNQDFFAYFYQPDCVHCEAVTPFLFPLADSMHKTVLPVNIEGKQPIWDEYKVHGTPTLIHFKNGKEVARIDGEHPEMEFSNFLNS